MLSPSAVDLSGIVGSQVGGGWLESFGQVSQGGDISKDQGLVVPVFISVPLRPERIPLEGQLAGPDPPLCPHPGLSLIQESSSSPFRGQVSLLLGASGAAHLPFSACPRGLDHSCPDSCFRRKHCVQLLKTTCAWLYGAHMKITQPFLASQPPPSPCWLPDPLPALSCLDNSCPSFAAHVRVKMSQADSPISRPVLP